MSLMKTLLRSEESGKTQPILHEWVYEHLRDRAGELARGWSKGTVLYEYIMLTTDAHEDDITRYEQRVDAELVELVGDTDIIPELGKIKISSIPSQYVSASDEMTDNGVELWLPESLLDDISTSEYWGERYWAQNIEDTVRDSIDSAYSDRLDRIQAKQEIINYLDSGDEPEHEVAQAVVTGESDNYTGYNQAHEILENREIELHERTEIPIDKFLERGSEIPQKPRRKREQALETALCTYFERTNYGMSEGKAYSFAERAFDDVREETAHDYVDSITLPENEAESNQKNETSETSTMVNAQEQEVSAWEACQTAKESVIEILDENDMEKKARRVERMAAPHVCLVDRDIVEDIDDTADSEKEAELIDQVLDAGTLSRYLVVSPQNEANDKLMTYLHSRKEDLLG
ncbi:hypothetical protein [Natrinema sp. 1APR25-10V2]|uniref:hypothetical protein n=1 Tax=Natrinema sp. 1APR25-10V2 TaxID=2951081 RepID=UPI002875DD82|nr:hypothetical protein [Natrinema sp. 1APR25-10V2]MDS0474798.1 hypothetical protein [Natrinema sp. 1APR25-10V2]